MPMMAVICGMPCGAHDGVVAEDATEVVGVREDLVLQGEEDALRNRRGRGWGCGFRGRSPGRGGPSWRSGKKAPAFTVASLATIMHSRPATLPDARLTTPAAGAPPHSPYISMGCVRDQVPGSSVPSSSKQCQAFANGKPALGALGVRGLWCRRPSRMVAFFGLHPSVSKVQAVPLRFALKAFCA